MKNMDIEDERRAQDALGALGSRALKGKVEYLPELFVNFNAEWAKPLCGEFEPGAVLYLHGGSYTAGGLDYAKGFGGVLAETINRDTLCVDYRKAPEHAFPAALDDAEEAYMRVLESHEPEKVAIVGESAGGGLSFALALRIKEKGLPKPGCVVAMSPWTDLTCSLPSHETLADIDPSLFTEALKYSAQLYGGEDLKNPLVSPLYGDVAGLPPCLIFAGSHEVLLDDSLYMAKKLRDADVPFELHVAEGMWHAYVLYGVPESKRALTRIDEFIDEHC